MDRRKRTDSFLVSEALLPLLFFSGTKLFYAALCFPVMAGLTLLAFEVLRFQPRMTLSSFYLFWLAAMGGLGWIVLGLPPYWIWCVYLLTPESVWAPSDAQRKKPFLFGLKKYFKRRVRELVQALFFAAVFAGVVTLLRQKVEGPLVFVLTVLALVAAEFVFARLRGLKP